MATKILIVDDDFALRRMLSTFLDRAGFLTLHAGNSAEALETFRSQNVALVLLDLRLDHESGLDLLKTIRRQPKTKALPVIVLSGACDREFVIEAGHLGVHSYLLKAQFSLKELLARVNRAIEGSDNPVAPYCPTSSPPTSGRIPSGTGAELAGPAAAPSMPAIGSQTQQPSTSASETAAISGSAVEPRHVPPDAIAAERALSPTTSAQKQVSGGESAPSTATRADDAECEPSRQSPMNEDEGALTVEEALVRLKDLKPFMSRTQILERVISDSTELKAMGPAARRVLSLSSSATASLEQVARAIKQDQALALRILKLANSSLYSRGDSIDTVIKAVNRIGLGQIRSAVMSMGVLDQFSNVGTIGRATGDWFWEHAISCGLIASRLAIARGSSPESADILFTAGLLHDVGRVLYASKLGSEYTAVVDKAEELELPLETVESRLLLMNHADLTDKLLRSWKFAPDMIDPISMHHLSVDNIRRVAPRAVTEVCTLALANRLCHALALGSSGNDVLYPIEDFVGQLEIEPEVIAQLCAEVPDAALDLRLSMMLQANSAGVSFLGTLREQVKESVCPLMVSLTPGCNPVAILLKRVLEDSADGRAPNVAVLRVCNARDRVATLAALAKEEQSRGVGPLPVLVVGNTKACLYTAAMLRDRTVRQIILPMRVSRILRELNESVLPGSSSIAA